MEFSLATGLKGKRGLIVGIANEESIAADCARAFAAARNNSVLYLFAGYTYARAGKECLRMGKIRTWCRVIKKDKF
jgi:enoyl-[acyl-carrier-protein] reductase (NADH)